MKLIRLLSVLAVASLVSMGVAHADWDIASMNKRIDASNFLIDHDCSGTLVASDKILTAAHCVVDKYETVEKDVVDDKGEVKKKKFRVSVPGTVSQQFYAGPSVSQTTSYVYKVVEADRKHDLALLEIPSVKNDASPVACDELVRGQTVYAVGNSYAVLYSTVTKGIVSSIARSYRDLQLAGQLGDTADDGDHGLIQHSAIIIGGNSGGALYNEKGELVGVNVRVGASGFSFSVPLDDVTAFLSSHGVNRNCK